MMDGEWNKEVIIMWEVMEGIAELYISHGCYFRIFIRLFIHCYPQLMWVIFYES